mmetsp:Transcript_90904/g.211520  ORF Transcript_90904/g.211520 Transcript_90904/m.211520 type:complete len:104 (-) Transcript_90904:250-561(-)|eukprot:CAMPEP_0171100544 /NCGR_PEP_ID=MMETSP0766_2-20121228/53022_1 /TAXON_ID=439317 /ORGANISM="Gambierdiscus australes, Strain CAWD 149" /LENGTH=103 /DNA_ID=CAMNT_0011560389 /DNA_START=64 /DNA_END=375 /DNA_ORIENTATION=-
MPRLAALIVALLAPLPAAAASSAECPNGQEVCGRGGSFVQISTVRTKKVVELVEDDESTEPNEEIRKRHLEKRAVKVRHMPKKKKQAHPATPVEQEVAKDHVL